jgi:hypothetical protein
MQLVVSELFVIFALWVTSVVIISTQFILVVLKIKNKDKLKILMYIVATILIITAWILSIYISVKISDWKIENFSKSGIINFHLAVSCFCFSFLLFGEILLLREILVLKDNSDHSRKKKREYIILGCAIIGFSIGCLLCIVVIAIYVDSNPWNMIYLSYIASLFYFIAPLFIFRKINKKRNTTGDTKSNQFSK